MKISHLVLGLALVMPFARPSAAAPERNACGCYKDGAGTCYCEKKAKCGCPGECEPKGCEEQRNKELQKEIEEETRKAEASDHRRAPAEPSAKKEESAPATKASGGHKMTKASGGHKMTAAQAKQLVKLIDLYLGDHPDARGRSIDDVRGDLSAR